MQVAALHCASHSRICLSSANVPALRWLNASLHICCPAEHHRRRWRSLHKHAGLRVFWCCICTSPLLMLMDFTAISYTCRSSPRSSLLPGSVRGLSACEELQKASIPSKDGAQANYCRPTCAIVLVRIRPDFQAPQLVCAQGEPAFSNCAGASRRTCMNPTPRTHCRPAPTLCFVVLLRADGCRPVGAHGSNEDLQWHYFCTHKRGECRLPSFLA